MAGHPAKTRLLLLSIPVRTARRHFATCALRRVVLPNREPVSGACLLSRHWRAHRPPRRLLAGSNAITKGCAKTRMKRRCARNLTKSDSKFIKLFLRRFLIMFLKNNFYRSALPLSERSGERTNTTFSSTTNHSDETNEIEQRRRW